MDRPKVTAKEWNALRERSPRAANALLDWIEGFVGQGAGVQTAEISGGTLVVETYDRTTRVSSSSSYDLTGKTTPPVWP